MALPTVKTVGSSVKVLQTGISVSEVKNKISIDMAQSRNFKVRLQGVYMDTSALIGRDAAIGDYLPVKNISFTESTMDYLQVPVGVLRNLPILRGISLPKMTLTLSDQTTDIIETQLRSWIHSCVPTEEGYVEYLDTMIRTLTYESYTVEGVSNNKASCSLFTVPSGEFMVNRDNTTNDLKSIEFGLFILAGTNELIKGI